MKKSIFEVIKTNKKRIVKGLIIGGSLAGLIITAALLKPKDEDIEVQMDGVSDEPSTDDSSDESSKEE